MVFFLTGGKTTFLGEGGLTVLMWSTGFMISSMVLLTLDLDPFFIESYAAQALLLIIVMLPIMLGISEIAELRMVTLYGVLFWCFASISARCVCIIIPVYHLSYEYDLWSDFSVSDF